MRGARIAAIALVAAGCADDAPILSPEERDALEELSPAPPLPPDASNRWADDAAAATFGQRLFFDARLSGALFDPDNDGSARALGKVGDVGKVSCAGCHVAVDGFSDTRSVAGQLSLGAGWGARRAPSLLDVGHSALLMWDGRRDSLYHQVFGPIESPVEMNSGRLYVAERVFADHRAEYEALFGPMPPLDDAARFPPLSASETGCRALDPQNRCTTPMRGSPGDGAEYDHLAPDDRTAVTRVVANIGKAIGAYERRLACGPSRFDAFMAGDDQALTDVEIRGAALFAGKAGCVRCHRGPMLSDEAFHNVGMRPQVVSTVFLEPDDPGAAAGLAALRADPLNVGGAFSDGDDHRDPQTLPAALLGAFRTPRLRCVAGRPSFMHTGQLRTLDQVVSFFNYGGDAYGFVGTSEITPLDLSSDERAALVAFLRSLDGPGPAPELLAPLR